MRKSCVLYSAESLIKEFARCCREYKELTIAVAWCGNPKQTLPYKYLEYFNGTIKATVGIAFGHTHPDAIEWFLDNDVDIRIFNNDAGLFHPKVYCFCDQNRYAIFIGSSNLTYGGFFTNLEVNSYIEEDSSEDASQDLILLRETLARWHTPEFSFVPTKHWLNAYRKRYKTVLEKQRTNGIFTPPAVEEEISNASWLQHADWNIYYQKVLTGLKQREREGQGYHDVLDAASREIPIPWKTQYFKDIEKRRIIGGIKQYGWLGHVAASGRFRRLLSNGTLKQWENIVQVINTVASINPPIPWLQLTTHLNQLISLGPTMKVWGRILCLIRPDLYCTVAAVSVRKNLSRTLNIPQSRFDGVEGYIQLIKLIHSSPWFSSNQPTDKEQENIWRRRVAFLDAIFY